MDDLQFLTDTQIYEKVIQEAIPGAERFVWMATSDLKDLHVHRGKHMVPFLEVLSQLVDRGVSIRLLHAKEPGPAFRRDFDRYPNLVEGMERVLCPRVHCKLAVVDAALAYIGSANFTGAGLGAKSSSRRNFESGIVTTSPDIVKAAMDQFDSIWMGDRCGDCRRREFCPDYRDVGLAE